jgi:DNA polymerase-3 subunit epsilon
MVPVLAASVDKPRALTGYAHRREHHAQHRGRRAARPGAAHPEPGSRSAIGNIRAAVANLIDYPDMEPELRERFLRVIDDEVAKRSRSSTRP